MAPLGPEKAPQNFLGDTFPKMLVFGWQEVKGQFWSILGVILFLFWMLFGYKLSNLSLSISFCFLVFRRIWVCLEMSKIQKTVHLWPKISRYGNLLDFMKYFMDSKYRQRLKLFRILKIYK